MTDKNDLVVRSTIEKWTTFPKPIFTIHSAITMLSNK